MKLSNRQALDLLYVAHELSNDRLPSQLTLALVKNTRRLQDEVDDFETARKSIVDAYSDREDAEEELKKELTELLDSEIDVQLHSVHFSVFENVSISQLQYVALEPMIEH